MPNRPRQFVERALAELPFDGAADGVEVDAEGAQRGGVVLAERGGLSRG
ncbi:hypothetical protein GCM10023258_36540 [Terrabacter aeriphilus]|uniref:Uncharacterized protein n=1 Tax=Terrabacter aeriphilus TaxID=515662 RepID=A0ABP9JKK3_9MICO